MKGGFNGLGLHFMNLQQFFIILWARKILLISCLTATVLMTLIVSLLMPKQFVATTALVLDQRGIDPVTGMVFPTQLLSGYLATQKEVIASHHVALKVVDLLNLTQDPKPQEDFRKSGGTGDIRDWLADGLLKSLEVLLPSDSSIIKLAFSAKDAEFSASVANAFAQAYIRTAVELKVQPAKHNADWFDEQLTVLRERMEQAHEKLSVFQQQHGIVKVEDQLDLEDARLAEIAKQLVESQGRTYALMSRKNQLAHALEKGGSYESMQEVLDNGFVQALKSDLARAEAKFAELANRIDKNHPHYLQAQAEIASLRQKIKQEVNTVLGGIASDLAASNQRDGNLSQALAEQKNKVLELKKQHDAMAILRREVENTQKAYDNAMQKTVQARMESEISQTNIAVLNPAIVPQYPSKPKVWLNMVLSVFIGTILGVGFVLLLELYDRRVRSSIDITESLALPVLGVMTAPHKSRNTLWKIQLAKGGLS